MKRTLSTALSSLAVMSISLIASCSNGNFKSSEKETKPDPTSRAGQESTQAGKAVSPGSEFAQAGKSLDLYIVMDKSGSLWVDPSSDSKTIGSGSDPSCKRMDALLDLLAALRTKLKSGERVRINVVTFGDNGESLGSFDNVVSKLNSEIEAKFRPGICDYPGRQSTKYAQGIKIALNDYAKNKGAGKFDLETTLFFSDGAAKDSPQELTDAINKLNSTFPKRVYGILLGKTSDVCTLEDNSGKNLSTEECLREVVGKDPNKVIQATDAAGLSAAMTSLLQK
jgi:hypothetical protein